ncbi:MAG: TerB family tellurite resistance protein [Myxococcales bacterium]|nr:TerB family tellurite resistance protein [Myxococcales bacterium]
MDSETAAITIMAKMALSDGRVSAEERESLRDILHADDRVDAAIERARQTGLRELVDALDRYADRFFVAVRALSMAAADARFDVKEEEFFVRLVEALDIVPGDMSLLLRRTQGDEGDPEADDDVGARLRELWRQSSFFVAETA